jgi:hypothetical protein
MKHFVVVERTDKHGSSDGKPVLQAVTGKGAGLDLAWFAADSPGGVHIWRFTDEAAANAFYRDRLRENRLARVTGVEQ